MPIRDEWERHRRYVASDGTCFGALEQHIPDMPRAEGTFVLILRFTLNPTGRHVGERPVTSCKPAQARAETRKQAEEYERGQQGQSDAIWGAEQRRASDDRDLFPPPPGVLDPSKWPGPRRRSWLARLLRIKGWRDA